MKRVGFLGCGKIGRAMLGRVQETGHEVAFVQDMFYKERADFPVVKAVDPAVLTRVDLIVECATADALRENFDAMITAADMLIFSLTAFSDEDFLQHAKVKAAECGHRMYFPHGAILGLDGISDARKILSGASIRTLPIKDKTENNILLCSYPKFFPL